MTETRGPLFLERRTYRRRRLLDAARLIPVLGILLWSVPLLWNDGSPAPAAPEARTATSSAMIYIFGVWSFLICAAFAVARRLARPEGDADPSRESG